MRLRSLLAAAPLAVLGCSNYIEVDGTFVAHNDGIIGCVQPILAGKEVGSPICPNGASRFSVEVSVPNYSGSYSQSFGPSDQWASIGVAFYNVLTGEKTKEQLCNAGGKVVTNIYYRQRRNPAGGYEGFTVCQASNSFDPEVVPLTYSDVPR